MIKKVFGGDKVASITDIKVKILELAPAPFQEFCDTLLSKMGYGAIHGLGMKAGTGNTTIGNPDTYFRKENGRYVFVAYTIQQTCIFSKLKEDIEKCLDTSKTGLDVSQIEEIVCCHTSSNLSAGDDNKLHEFCNSKGIKLSILGIDELAEQVHNHYRNLAKDYLGLNIDTNQIMDIDDFVFKYDSNQMAAPLNTIFLYRENEIKEIEQALKDNPVVVITGKAGVGKTRLALEILKQTDWSDEYKILCVKNNNLGIYDDLCSATEDQRKYIFFVDDANELAQLNLILERVNKAGLENELKIIVTVRNYAKSKLIMDINEVAEPKIMEIEPFSDDEIKGFIDKNLEIRNEDYVEQIIRISEGNPRIAYMAGKLAIEKQNLIAIKDVSQLYETYYSKYIDSTLGTDRDLCFTAGVLSVINAVVLSKISVLQEVLNNYGISNEDFQKKIYELAQMEVVEVQLNQVATLSDQCLANYMLYYVFFEKKLVSLSGIINIGYKNFRSGLIKSINTILKIFENENTKQYCKQEILAVWNTYKNTKDRCYTDFAKDFHIFNPEEAFLQANETIEQIKEEKFLPESTDIERNTYCVDADVLSYLTGYQYSEYMSYVMELLIIYCSKNKKTFAFGQKWLENYYGVDIDSNKFGYYTQIEVSKSLLDMISRGSDIAEAIGLYWVKYALAFSFQPTEIGRGNKMMCYHLELTYSNGLKEFRSICWKILISLSTNKKWLPKIFAIMEEYSRNIQGDPDCDVVKGEVEYVEKVLETLNSDRISFLKVLRRLLKNADAMNIKYDRAWGTKFSGNQWMMYRLLENDFVASELEYEDYEKQREEKLAEYGKQLKKEDIKNWVKSVNDLLSDKLLDRDTFTINQGIQQIVNQMDVDELQEFLKAYIEHGTNMNVRPWSILEKLNKLADSRALLLYIKESTFPQKDEWMFSFFETLPKEKVNAEYIEELLGYLRGDLDKSITSPSFRDLRMLDKFMVIDSNIYPVVCGIIYEKRHYNSFIAETYLESLFNDKIYSPNELLLLFNDNINLLQEIYFYMFERGQFTDYSGVFLLEFLILGESWLQKYAELFWKAAEKHRDHDYHIYEALWKTDDYIKYFDGILYYAIDKREYKSLIRYKFSHVFARVKDSEIVEQHKRNWIEHIVSDNAMKEQISVIFEMLSELNENLRRLGIKTFLECNADYSMFENLMLVPNHWSGGGSLVPAYQKQIDFLESLYEYTQGIKYLRHKAKIKEKVGLLQRMIKDEEVAVICRNLYM